MKILIIQENGRHDLNRNFRECFCLQRGFQKLNHEAIVWGLGHSNYNEQMDFNSFDLIINLENYGGDWEPDLSNVKTKKFLWSIDAHFRGEEPFIYEYNRGKYDILLHSTKDYVNQPYKIWFPNAFDDTLIHKKDIDKKCDVGFCGNMLNRNEYILKLSQRYNFTHDNFVIGDNMVNSINSYKIHWNKNVLNDVNYRSFETIGCGTKLVTNYNYQYELLGFKHGENVMMYKNDIEIFECIDILLNDTDLMKSISEFSLELSKRHTYFKRVEKLIEIYNNIT
jgi:hypothetical protein